MVGGGVYGRAAGIAHITMTEAGVIISVFQVFILMWTLDGEGTTETMIGKGTDGTMNEFLTNDFNKTGRVGKIVDIGKGMELGASKTFTLGRNNRDRN